MTSRCRLRVAGMADHRRRRRWQLRRRDSAGAGELVQRLHLRRHERPPARGARVLPDGDPADRQRLHRRCHPVAEPIGDAAARPVLAVGAGQPELRQARGLVLGRPRSADAVARGLGAAGQRVQARLSDVGRPGCLHPVERAGQSRPGVRADRGRVLRGLGLSGRRGPGAGVPVADTPSVSGAPSVTGVPPVAAAPLGVSLPSTAPAVVLHPRPRVTSARSGRAHARRAGRTRRPNRHARP